MGLKNAVIIALFALMSMSGAVSAQTLEDDATMSAGKPISLLPEDAKVSVATDLETFDPTISYYVQNLNLTPEQLDRAQLISESEQEKKDALMRQIEALRQKAYNLEAGSLIAFEAILDDAQKAAFRELRAEKLNMQKSAENEYEKSK